MDYTIHLQSQIIRVLRIPLIVLVVFAHMLPFEQEPIRLSLRSYDIYHFISELISHNLARLSTCCYFVFSGYFFFVNFSKWDNFHYLKKLKKRIWTLLIPYLIWNSILVLAVHFKNQLFLRLSLPPEPDYTAFSLLTPFELFWQIPVNFPLWFLRDLMVMNILAPVFFFYFKYTKAIGLLILFILYAGVIELPVPGFSSIAIFFFGLGSYIALSKYTFIKVCHLYRKKALWGGGIFLLLTLYSIATPWYEYLKRIYLIFGIVIIFQLGYQLIKAKWLKNILISLSSTSFFIYVSHEVYIINWLKGALMRSPLSQSGWGMLLGYFITPFICIGIIIFLNRLLKRLSPKFLNILIGNRIQ